MAKPIKAPDPVYRIRGKWWFYDETYCEHGPFDTEAEARAKLRKYCETL